MSSGDSVTSKYKGVMDMSVIAERRAKSYDSCRRLLAYLEKLIGKHQTDFVLRR